MKEIDYSSMGIRIRQLRKAKGWSQDVLAGKCGISMSFLGHIERGSRVMSMETFVNICDALDAGADEILWGVMAPSDVVQDIWELPNKNRKMGRKAEECDGAGAGEKAEVESCKNDNYAMYVKIMKSVAEILNESVK